MTFLFERNLFETRDMVADAIQRIQGYAPLAGPEGYYVAYSGGKDSVVILELCKMAGVKFEAHHSLTTIDPPEYEALFRRYFRRLYDIRKERGLNNIRWNNGDEFSTGGSAILSLWLRTEGY